MTQTGTLTRNVVLVEDDKLHQELYSAWLETAGFRVKTYACAAEFRRRRGASEADVVVFDWHLPDATGLQLLAWLKQSDHAVVPVLFLTGNDEESSVVEALRKGADDYVIKPARRAELVARIRALLRRSGGDAGVEGTLEVPPFRLDTHRGELSVGGDVLKLTNRELELLTYLFRRPGRLVSRDALLKEIWNVSGQVTTRTIDTHISRLRKKAQLAGEHGWRLSSIYMHGYRLEQVAESTV